MLLLIDNYDSFTYNLVHYLGEIGAETRVVRNDALTVEEAISLNPRAIVVSPGPCDPSTAGICVDLIRTAAADIPIFGVCLGHQSIGEAFGGKIVREKPMHGKVSKINHTNQGIFRNLPKSFNATRYHSLIIERNTLPDSLAITAETEDGVIMGIQHKEHNIHGVQFHPESIASEHGHTLIDRFLELAKK